jgi:SET domain
MRWLLWWWIVATASPPALSFHPVCLPLGQHHNRIFQRKNNTLVVVLSTTTTTVECDESGFMSRGEEDGLTKDELALRFQHVLEHYRQKISEEKNTMSLESVQRNLLCTRLSDLRLNRCHVAPSSIRPAGWGVFASREIQAGELITLFPGDALLVWNTNVGDVRGGLTVQFGRHISPEDRDTTRVTSPAARIYELNIIAPSSSSSQSIVADPRRVDNPAYLAHMINDGSCLQGRDKAARTEYAKNSARRHNAAFFDLKGCHYMAEATKHIRQGEEIFVSYGEGYWLSRISTEETPRKTSSKGFSRLTDSHSN